MPFLDTIHTVGRKPSMFGERKINQSIKTSLLLCTCRSDSNQMVSFLHWISVFLVQKGYFWPSLGNLSQNLVCLKCSPPGEALCLCLCVCLCVCVFGGGEVFIHVVMRLSCLYMEQKLSLSKESREKMWEWWNWVSLLIWSFNWCIADQSKKGLKWRDW